MLRTLLITALLGLALSTTITYPGTCGGSAPFNIVTSGLTDQTDKHEYDLDLDEHSVEFTTETSNLYSTRDNGWGKITKNASSDTDLTITSIRVHSPAEFQVGGQHHDVEVQLISTTHTFLIFYDTDTSSSENDFLKDVIASTSAATDVDADDATDGYETIGKFYEFTSTSTVDCSSSMTYVYWPRI
eukprot:CAMPEP_0168316442 /NCGR_PEP_ID=MMETSP0210-20121227/15486_1 /TAXON_ID=40633 /ORGANISM="Condylostoma magnum, Strain COL2" /LENGTH=186 /DNA_ID=CAMNT_0008297085 /DNA_START=27 /DNA_END=587 /DNA_ORIENTATION=-